MGPADWDAQWYALHPGEGVRPEGYHGESGGGGGGSAGVGGFNVPPFNFDWQAAEKEALEKLTPYYKQKLDEAQGDVDRAKRLIEEDYARGVRYRKEDEATSMQDLERTAKDERLGTLDELNRRGVLFGEQQGPQGASRAPYSQFAQQFYLNPQEERIGSRQAAIRRALERQGEVAGIERQRGIEEQDIAFPRYKTALEEEKKEKAVTQMAPLKYTQELSKYNATVGRSLMG